MMSILVHPSAVPTPKAQLGTLLDLLRRRAAEHPEQVIYTQLNDFGEKIATMTYRELEIGAQAVAVAMQATIEPGDRVIVACPHGLDFITAFFGCIYAGAIAVPAYPPNKRRWLERLRQIAQDSGASAIVGRQRQIGKVVIPGMNLNSIALEGISTECASDWQEPKIGSQTIAFLQYTSGSTGDPKGIMVSHGNILHNEKLIYEVFGQGAGSIVVGWLPMYHDMGLVGTVLQPLYAGTQCIVLSPHAFLQRPFRWLEAISRFQADTSGGPNFAYDLCVDKVTEEELATLDLSCWRVAFNGAEPVRSSTLNRFSARFGACGFRRSSFFPCYGLAEATLLVSGLKPAPDCAVLESQEDGKTRPIVSCGSWGTGEIAIVDEKTSEVCGEGKIGEIWVASPSVAEGYWNQPEQTERIFGARLPNSNSRAFLRTGDRGFIHAGELFVTGRIKDLIIVRGHNYHPNDLEATVETATRDLGMGACVAFGIEADGEERVVIMQEIGSGEPADSDTVIATIRHRMADEHELAPYAIILSKPGSIRRTSSGKPRRFACREAFFKGEIAALASWIENFAESPVVDETVTIESPADVEEWLIRQIAGMRALRPASIDPGSPFDRCGIDSLQSIELINRVIAKFGVHLPLTTFMSETTIADLGPRIWNARRQSGQPQEKVSHDFRGNYPLSFGQQGLWFLHQIEPESSTYNIAHAVRICTAFDPGALRRAFELLVARHAALRTAFDASAGMPCQRIEQQVELPFFEEDVTSCGDNYVADSLSAEASRPFVLGRAPLIRVRLFHRDDSDSILLLVVHHIIADLWSLAVLIRELGVLYNAEVKSQPAVLPRPGADFVLYVDRQRELLSSEAGEKLWDYWRNQLANTTPLLNLPFDHSAQPGHDYRCLAESFTLGRDTTRKIKKLARDNGTTLFTTLLALYQTLLYRYCGQERFCVGSPIISRPWPEFAETIGYFANTIVLPANFAEKPNFMTVLARTQETVLGALDHGEYPFQLLVERLNPEAREFSQSTLFQTMFVFQPSVKDNSSISHLALRLGGVRALIGELAVESVYIPDQVANFSLTLVMAERDGKMHASLEYQKDFFQPGTMRRLAASFRMLARQVLADPLRPVSELQLLSRRERRQILIDWNATETDLAADACLHQFIKMQSEKTSDRVAVRTESEQLSYYELDWRSDQLASLLLSTGVRPDSVVAVFIERSLEMMVALLGVLKSGGAYLPLDPTYPSERLRYVLKQSRASIVLTTSRLAPLLPAGAARIVCLDNDCGDVDEHRASNSDGNVYSGNLAYVIYTSGSTGHPKGVMNTHSGIVNRLLWMQRTFGLTAEDRVLQKTPATFDVSVWELFWPLMSGACLVFAAPERHREPPYLIDLIRRESITTIHFVPSMLKVFLAEREVSKCRSLRRVIASGEALTWDIQQEFFAKLDSTLHNLYGPTEAAIDVTAWRCQEEQFVRPVPIGYPIANTRIYILDPSGQPVPVNVPGEVFIGGLQLARGYLNSPSLTAENFVPDPFGEASSRCYSTGDIGRFRADGAIEFLGRRDHQVKIRGFRIEPHEIEMVLKEQECIQDSVVIARPNAVGETQLVAYVVPRDGCRPTVHELRTALRVYLPEYLVPSLFVVMDELPTLPNGKLNRRVLPVPESTRPDIEEVFVAPRTPVEETVAQIWSEMLGFEHIGVRDNFFELGGHSLQVTQIAFRIYEAFGVDIPLRDLFDEPTIEGLATVIMQSLQHKDL
jgi:amino acid adenylation domain-containing protein